MSETATHILAYIAGFMTCYFMIKWAMSGKQRPIDFVGYEGKTGLDHSSFN